MIKRFMGLLTLAFAMVLAFTNGRDPMLGDDIIGRSYVYEKDGFGGDFSIIISDGTFSYYEGWLSSYIGTGKWRLEGNTLILSDDEQMGYPRVNYFMVDGNDLVFLAENSSNFLYVQVADGERFTGDLMESSGNQRNTTASLVERMEEL